MGAVLDPRSFGHETRHCGFPLQLSNDWDASKGSEPALEEHWSFSMWAPCIKREAEFTLSGKLNGERTACADRRCRHSELPLPKSVTSRASSIRGPHGGEQPRPSP
jgi:hypothetical protein